MLRIPGGVKKLIQLFFKLSGRIIKSHQPGGIVGYVERAVPGICLPVLIVIVRKFGIKLTRKFARLHPAAHEARLRSEEHTSELQSRGHLVCRLLLDKKK